MGAPIDTIIQGDALTVLKTLDANSVDICVTSPPYWGLRDYKTDGQLGLEPTFNEYLDHLIQIFTEVKRVTKGTIWINIGDTYNGKKSLCGIPERFAILMTDKLGLIRRNTIIWHKPNCMPSSVRDRFTVDFEYVYFFTKSQRYYFETQYEPYLEASTRWGGPIRKRPDNPKYETRERPDRANPLGRIKRSVWRIPTKPFSGAHFAVFPPTLIEPMIKSGCPEQICNKCGKSALYYQGIYR